MLKEQFKKLPDPIKLIIFFGGAFIAGYTTGSFGYQNTEIILAKICRY